MNTTIAGFVVIGVAAAVLQLAAHRVAWLPRFEECLGRLMRHPALRLAVLLAWWWAGWHFLAR